MYGVSCRAKKGRWRENVGNMDWWLFRCLKRKIYIGERSHKGWSGCLPHYIIYCKRHGPVITYPQGYGQHLECPFCQ